MASTDIPGTPPAQWVMPPDPFLLYLGVRVSPEGEEPIVCEIDLAEDLRNSGGVLNGGVIATLVDVAGGVAAARAQNSPHISTSSLHTQYLSPVRVGPARATARVARSGRRSTVVQVEIVDAGVEEDDVVALATVSLTRVGARRDEVRDEGRAPSDDQ